MEIIYSEITNGRPVVLQVNGDKAGTKRHYVTVVGFNSSIASGSQLRPESLLVIDTIDNEMLGVMPKARSLSSHPTISLLLPQPTPGRYCL